MENKYIYVIFSRTNTRIGSAIRLVTHNQFNHVSISFNKRLTKWYSFGRFHINSPFAGGFIIEYPERYLSENNDILIKVCKLPVDDEIFFKIEKEVKFFISHKDDMLYNSYSAVMSLFGKKLYANNTFTCLEFVTHILGKEEITNIRALEKYLENYVIYFGSYKEKILHWRKNCNEYFVKRGYYSVIYETVSHFQKLRKRIKSSRHEHY